LDSRFALAQAGLARVQAASAPTVAKSVNR
jgi:hypothetical protein